MTMEWLLLAAGSVLAQRLLVRVVEVLVTLLIFTVAALAAVHVAALPDGVSPVSLDGLRQIGTALAADATVVADWLITHASDARWQLK